jgi:dGTPase
VPLIGPILMGVRRDYPDLDERLTRLEAVRRMIGDMIADVLAETQRRAEAGKVRSDADVRGLGHALVAFSPTMNEDLSRLRKFLYERMYRHWRVNRTRSQARRILAEMFQLFLREPEVMPNEWGAIALAADEMGRARLVCDYIAGMTDRYAIEEHRKLFQLDAWS